MSQADRGSMEQMLSALREEMATKEAEWEKQRQEAAEKVLELEVKLGRQEKEVLHLVSVREGLEGTIDALKEGRAKADERIMALEKDRYETSNVVGDVLDILRRLTGGRETVQRAARMLDKDWQVLGKGGRINQTLVSMPAILFRLPIRAHNPLATESYVYATGAGGLFTNVCCVLTSHWA